MYECTPVENYATPNVNIHFLFIPLYAPFYYYIDYTGLYYTSNRILKSRNILGWYDHVHFYFDWVGFKYLQYVLQSYLSVHEY